MYCKIYNKQNYKRYYSDSTNKKTEIKYKIIYKIVQYYLKANSYKLIHVINPRASTKANQTIKQNNNKTEIQKIEQQRR